MLRAFQDAGDPVTVGWGHTGQIEDPLNSGNWRDLRLGDQITPAYADMLFDKIDSVEAERRVDKYFPNIPLTQAQRDALFDFCFNISLRTLSEARGSFTLGQLIRTGQISKDLMLEWFPKYRNPRTIHEEGLYRRRLFNACRFLGCDLDISEHEAWKAELRRDDRGDISFRTDPQLVYLRALNETDKRKAAAREATELAAEKARARREEERLKAEAEAREGEARRAAEEAKAEQDAAEEAAKASRRDDEAAPVSQEPRETQGDDTRPVEATRGTPRTYERRIPASPPAPEVDPDDVQYSKPEFWSLQMLLFGRVALAFGFANGIAAELILDPAFQAAFGGAIAIYISMFMRARAKRQAEKRRERRARIAEMEGELDAG